MMQLMSDNCIFENSAPAPDGAVYSGKPAVTQFWQDFFRASPHAHMDIEDILVLAFIVSFAGGTIGWIQAVRQATYVELIYST